MEKYGPVFSVHSVSRKHYANIKQWEYKINKKVRGKKHFLVNKIADFISPLHWRKKYIFFCVSGRSFSIFDTKTKKKVFTFLYDIRFVSLISDSVIDRAYGRG